MEKPLRTDKVTQEEIELSKKMSTVDEARRRIIEGGGFFIFQNIIDIPTFRDDLVKFARSYVPSSLNYAALLKWFQANNLERYLQTGSLEKQIKAQENFYQRFYSKEFRIQRKKIFVDSRRLPAIKAGLEAGCINQAIIKATPDVLTEAEAQMTGAEFFYERLAKPLKKDGFKIWAETGTDRWTKLTLVELLQRCNPTEPEEFSETFQEDWVTDEMRVIGEKNGPSKITACAVEIVFTSNEADIPRDQKIVNKNGEMVELANRSYVSAITKKVRVVSHEEGIILACQLYAKDKTYLALNTWEWRRDVVDHRDKSAKPSVSVASADSDGSEFSLYSDGADNSYGGSRLRLAL